MVLIERPTWLQHAETTTKHKLNIQQQQQSNTETNSNSRLTAIYSVDLYASHIATGGGDHLVKIWDVEQLFKSKYVAKVVEGSVVELLNGVVADQAASDEDVKQSLATLSHHEGSVLCVRYSPCGRFLATSSDDTHIILYDNLSISNNVNNAFTTTNNSNHNNMNNIGFQSTPFGESNSYYRRRAILRGHNLDVVSLSFSPDSSTLASASLDRNTPIIIWSLNDQHGMIWNPLKIIGTKEHRSVVKGVAFDPIGTYLATSGDDPSICVWNTETYELEHQLDERSGIFGVDAGDNKEQSQNFYDENPNLLHSLSLFRRIGFSPDGLHLCATNAKMSGKNIAAMVSRDGWTVSTNSDDNDKERKKGSANLVGHKQAVVASRYCVSLFENIKKTSSTEDKTGSSNTSYSTVIALGDKKGYLSVWSTKRSRPLFKLQLSVQKNVITDLAWSRDGKILLATNLDGAFVAIQFDDQVIGKPLSLETRNKILFEMYGINLSEGCLNMKNKNQLLESITQMELEENDDTNNGVHHQITPHSLPQAPQQQKINILTARKKNDRKVLPHKAAVSTKNGKKRIQPTLIQVQQNIPVSNRSLVMTSNSSSSKIENNNKQSQRKDPVKQAQEAAVAAKAMLKTVTQNAEKGITRLSSNATSSPMEQQLGSDTFPSRMIDITPVDNIKFSLELVSADKKRRMDSFVEDSSLSTHVEVTNFVDSSTGILSAKIGLFVDMKATWAEILVAAKCTALAGSKTLFVVGCYDGSVYLYGSSSTCTFDNGNAIRISPPIIFSSSICSLHLTDKSSNDGDHENRSKISQKLLVVLCSDGTFHLLDISTMKSLVSGSALPAFHTMILSARANGVENIVCPKVLRLHLTKAGVMLILSMPKAASSSIQAFLYNDNLNLWQRISDGRFSISDFFNTVPCLGNNDDADAPLSRLDSTVSRGLLPSSIEPSNSATTKGLLASLGSTNTRIISRSHCEDRMACALALKSSDEFEYWFGNYVKVIMNHSNAESQLRFLFDTIVGNGISVDQSTSSCCWWLQSSSTYLTINSKAMIERRMISEMSRTRSLQRLTQELTHELEMMP